MKELVILSGKGGTGKTSLTAAFASLAPDVVLADCDVVIDGTDDFETRFIVNAACVRAGVPLVSGALGRWSGQIGVFSGRPCYQCLVPEIPPDAETCARVGVVGALAGVIGGMAVMEVPEVMGETAMPTTHPMASMRAVASGH